MLTSQDQPRRKDNAQSLRKICSNREQFIDEFAHFAPFWSIHRVIGISERVRRPASVASGAADIVGLYLDKPQAPRQRKLMGTAQKPTAPVGRLAKLSMHERYRSVLLQLLAPVRGIGSNRVTAREPVRHGEQRDAFTVQAHDM
jgi:hypothetical protein